MVEVDDVGIEEKVLAHASQSRRSGPSDGPRTSGTMHEGTWTVRPCPHRLQTELARELGISELTASTPARRGYATTRASRAFLAAADGAP